MKIEWWFYSSQEFELFFLIHRLMYNDLKLITTENDTSMTTNTEKNKIFNKNLLSPESWIFYLNQYHFKYFFPSTKRDHSWYGMILIKCLWIVFNSGCHLLTCILAWCWASSERSSSSLSSIPYLVKCLTWKNRNWHVNWWKTPKLKWSA